MMHEQLHNLRHTWLRHEYIKQFTAIMTRIPKTIYCSTSWKDYRDGLRLNFNIEERKAWKVQSLHMDGLSFARLIRLTMGLSRVVMEGTREYLSHLTMINEKHCPKLKGIRRIRVDWSQEKAGRKIWSLPWLFISQEPQKSRECPRMKTLNAT